MSLPQGMTSGSQSYMTSPIDPPNQTSSRRMSMPTPAAAKDEATSAADSKDARPRSSREPSAGNQTVQTTSNTADEASQPTSMGPPSQPSLEQSQTMPFSPLSMSLPQDSQQLLGPAMNSSDPFMSMLMAGASTSTSGLYDYMPYGQAPKPVQQSLGMPGMNTTLAPSALSMSPNQDGAPTSAEYFDALPSNYADLKGFEFPGSQNSSNGENAGQDNSWEALIDDKSWRESTA